MKSCPKCGYRRPLKPFKPPSRQELENGWLQVEFAMRLAFSYHVWNKRCGQCEKESEDCELMRIAALECTLLNIRAVDEFFRQQTWSSDIRAAQYPGFDSPGPFLSPGEKRKLDQLVAHLTYNRIHEFDFTWKTAELLQKAYRAFASFLSYVERAFYEDQLNVKASLKNMKRRFEKWLVEAEVGDSHDTG